MAKYNKNALTLMSQKIAKIYIKELIADPNTCSILKKKLKKQLKEMSK